MVRVTCAAAIVFVVIVIVVTICLHLVENLLARLGLSDQIGVGTARRDELLDLWGWGR